MGRFLRPKNPNAEKLEVYECGEPTIGSSFVQFDIRFYVVALLFIIFDVEVAFFFPWANVFGKATQLKDPNFAVVQEAQSAGGGETVLTPAAAGIYRELGVPPGATPQLTADQAKALAEKRGHVLAAGEGTEFAIRSSADDLAWLALVDIFVFFAVLMVLFAYVLRRGDLDWVRVVTEERAVPERVPPSLTVEREPALSA